MLLQVLHIAQAALAGYGGQQSYNAIQNLQKYEETAQKMAKYSNEAERQLKKTRTTQAAGVVALALSLVASVLLAFRGRSMGFLVRTLASPFMAGCLFLAQQYMKDYWGGSKRVPLPKMGSYNDAQKQTEDLLQVLERLMFLWFATSVLCVLAGY
ncbi:uncharacterized protein PG998_001703 [Apiospora kogelbergensis]|uniref:Uncharacterized protein n=1 Tax=Apiospora kogelbergensis TaxID=1337665 RepID=A0AAW0QPT6_9PEZI